MVKPRHRFFFFNILSSFESCPLSPCAVRKQTPHKKKPAE